jgi:hypothetical protein
MLARPCDAPASSPKPNFSTLKGQQQIRRRPTSSIFLLQLKNIKVHKLKTLEG